MQVLAFANQKGGCGKTTTAVNLAGALAALGERVLLVDLDPQAHATLGLGIAVEPESPTIARVLDGRVPLREVVRTVPGGVQVVPAGAELSDFEDVASRGLRPERRLAAALRSELGRWDRVLVDCPPRVDGVLCANAVRAASDVVLVVETGAFALQGALAAERILRSLASDLAEPDEPMPRFRVLATMLDRRTRFAREVLIAMQGRFGPLLFDTAIRSSVRLREAAAFGVPVHVLDARSSAASDFRALAEELLASSPEGLAARRARSAPNEGIGLRRIAAPTRPSRHPD